MTAAQAAEIARLREALARVTAERDTMAALLADVLPHLGEVGRLLADVNRHLETTNAYYRWAVLTAPPRR